MPENLCCKTQKANSEEFDANYDRIFRKWDATPKDNPESFTISEEFDANYDRIFRKWDATPKDNPESFTIKKLDKAFKKATFNSLKGALSAAERRMKQTIRPG